MPVYIWQVTAATDEMIEVRSWNLMVSSGAGLAYAWVVVRTARFMTTHLHLEGELDLAAIEQTSQQVPTGGEGLAEALDLGSI